MKEIGSEFWEIPCKCKNDHFPKKTEWFASGRSALQAILNENDFKTAAVPTWCCDSMIIPFINNSIDLTFYSDCLPQSDVALVLDYFGYTSYGVDTSVFNGVIIRDLTHSLFSKEYRDADYYFGSLRKWAGFATGGFAQGLKNKVSYDENNGSYVELRKKAMRMKKEHILEKSNCKEYLSIFASAEKMLDDIKIAPADNDDIVAAQTLDVRFIKEQRRKNAQILMDAFEDLLIYPVLLNDDCPLFVPIRVNNRDGLRKYLIDHQIYCPIHWPASEYHKLDEQTKKLYLEELSLVCDQRYTEQDMRHIVKIIREFLGEDYA